MPIAHELTAPEQALLDGLLERFRFTPVVVRLTGTMLEKSIIDARLAIQAYLARTGLIEYGNIGQGLEDRVQITLPLVSGMVAERRRVSFYRPRTKRGDPRFSIERLASIAAPGDALVLAFTDSDLVLIHLRGPLEQLTVGLNPLLASRFEARGELESLVRRLGNIIHPLASQWVQTQRSGPTGVGFTLESLLGIAANSSPTADLDGLELKAYRRGPASGPGKLLSLFSQVPNWMGINKGAGLLQEFGYDDPVRRRRALYCTITTRTNSLHWRLYLNPAVRKVFVVHRDRPVVAYDFDALEARLREKHPATLFVKASTRGTKASEEFKYDEVVLFQEPSLANLLDLLMEDLIGLDFTLHTREDGSPRDHGFLWRIRESALPRLFAYRRTITAPD